MMEWSLRSLGEGPLAGQFSDLGRRSASGLVLAVVALGLAYAGGVAFSALILVVGSIMSWEWGRIVRRVDADMACLAHAAAIVVATTLAAAGQLMFAGISLAIGTIAVLSLAFHRATLLSALGVLYVGVPAVLLVTLRGDLTYGLAAVTFVMLLAALLFAALATWMSLRSRRMWA